MKRHSIWMGLGVVLLVAVAIGAWAFQQYRTSSGDGLEGGEVALPSTQGDFSLAQLEDDQLAVLFFGYTYCPDVCPMTMAVMRQALQRLDEDVAERVMPVMITVDPERDTLERLEEYVGYFGESFIGARGSQEQLEDIADRYGIFWRKVEMDNSEMEYTVDHSSSLYLVDREGRIRQRVLYSPNPHSLVVALESELGRR
ncbi:SCO family protein [Litchfieldella rifensis]|uniref:SCO family protein n=1 Tax=Litchfieldella rifensis TaxID=762643 RepID=A0ABV7LT15_9GAMM